MPSSSYGTEVVVALVALVALVRKVGGAGGSGVSLPRKQRSTTGPPPYRAGRLC
ncbi:hypothetical protein [Streptomyces sp. NRRL S-1448]|uniref:hypothetical protein n=1 Tax=Streptomyces sp. NRRL S-1448 TaxID=1463883 RepID=UPI00131DB744|nr:hypothetical protein [Streptomyces sp. NRRL S-1448]